MPEVIRKAMVAALLLVSVCIGGCNGSTGGDDGGGDSRVQMDNGTDKGPDLSPDAGPLARAVELTATPGFVIRRELIHDGQHFVAVWTFKRATESEFRVMLARISDTGAIISGPTELLTTKSGVADLRLLPIADGFTLWYRFYGYSGTIYVLRLDRQGTPLGSPLDVGSYSTQSPNSYGDHLGVAWSGQHYALLHSKPSSTYQLAYRLLDKDFNSVVPVTLVHSAYTYQYDPHVVWLPKADGGNGAFWLLWRRDKRVYTTLVNGTDGAVITATAALHDNNESQYRPRVTIDGQGRPLVSWSQHGPAAPRFLLVDPTTTTSLWTKAATWLPDNRVATLDHSVAVKGDRALCAWASDASSSLAQIRVGEADLAQTTPTFGGEVTLSDPTYPISSPRVVAGHQGFAVLFSSVVQGSDHLYLRLLP